MSQLFVDVRSTDASAFDHDTLRHAALIDRAQLRLAFWLLVRSAERMQRTADPASHGRILANERSRAARENATLRLHQNS